jgi:citrate lyase gamma subunit
MTNPTIRGYLDDPYLDPPYLGGTVDDYFGMELQRVITNQVPMGSEVSRRIDSTNSIGMEVHRNIVDYQLPLGTEVLKQLLAATPLGAEIQQKIADVYESHGMEVHAVLIKDYETGMEIQFKMNKQSAFGMEVYAQVLDTASTTAMQSELVFYEDQSKGMETHRIIQEYRKATGEQSRNFIKDKNDFFGFEVRMDKSFPHIKCEQMGYLEQPYLEDPYLVAGYCVPGPMEIQLILKKQPSQASQIHLFIQSMLEFGQQIRLMIKDYLHPIAMQINRIRATSYGMQIKFILYNTTNLRVMVDFPSRGTTGTNWTASSTETGDFSVNNLNTDIVEQRWQSAAGTTTAVLECDTEKVQGVAVDTLGILNHNLTTSAYLIMEGSNFADFSAIGETIVPTIVRDEDIYWIAPTYPNKQWRYWRFTINDPTNSDGNLKIGTIIFGTTIILQGENFTDIVRKRKIHFADKIATEGYTSITNDRALKKSVGINFDKIQYTRGNYKNLNYVFDFARTSLKCLWVPDPRYPARFAIFGKLTDMPEETHNVICVDADYVDFSIEVNEAL